MKNFLVVIVLMLVMCVVVSTMVQAQSLTSLASGSAFANDSTYTLTAPSGTAKYDHITALFTSTDTVNVRIIAQTRPSGSSTWTAKDTTTINVNSTSVVSEYVYRNNTTDKIPGLSCDIRFVFEFISSGNGVSGTRTFSYVLYYTK